MSRFLVSLAALAVLVLALPLARADDPPAAAPGAPAASPPAAAPAARPRPPIASDEEAARALERFADDFRARGLTGEDKMSQRDYAMSNLAKVQHPDVVKALAKIARSPDDTLKTLATIYLGEQRALPGIAGPEVVHVLLRNEKDDVLVLSALESLGNLGYLGATEEIADLLVSKEFAVRKAAVGTVGELHDMRLWKEVAKLAGVSIRSGDKVASGSDKQNSKEEVTEEGWSYDGVEVTYDTGASGDSDQKMAEQIGREKLAQNKAQAQSGAHGGHGGSSGGGATRGGVARDPKELLPYVLATLYKLTGEQFNSPHEVAQWIIKHRDVIDQKVEDLEAQAKAQKDDAKAQK